MSELANQAVTKQLNRATETSRIMTMVLEGELDRADVQDITDMLARKTLEGVVEIVIDFEDVTHFDYRGVKPLVRRAETLRELGGDIKLSGMSPYLHAIFRSAGAHDSFDYFSQSEEAVRSFDRGVLLYG
ncbi:MAG: STAS domain-containing protein [Archangium sp.]|nr:STAS domain-containing protein [Archangium sp.]MDP3156321.1 STAS domain-containing protein [Archangium sp.]MDP3570365.1 STAS domain-containing protein [Archangium sp.]